MGWRFEVCLAYWTFASLYHDGQGSVTYAYLSRLARLRFNPRGRADPDALEGTAREVFDRLCERHGVRQPDDMSDVWARCEDCNGLLDETAVEYRGGITLCGDCAKECARKATESVGRLVSALDRKELN